jgi:hypothetical protein
MFARRVDEATASLFKLTVFAAGLGVAAAGAAWVLVHLIAGITNLALLHTLSWDLPPSNAFTRSPTIVVGHRHRHGRAVRGGRPDHRHWERDRFARRPGAPVHTI